MPCLDSQNWNLTDFIGAFLNLAIAYLLLCVSLFVHIVLKFLGFLGLALPIFHNGRFGYTNARKSLEGSLLDCASERISSINRSIKSKIPFNSTTNDDESNQLIEFKLVRKNNGDISNTRIKDENSSRFLPTHQQETEDDLTREEQNVINHKDPSGFNLMTVQGMKGKRLVTRRSRNSLRSHRRGLRSFSSSEALDERVKSPFMHSSDLYFRSSNERSSNPAESKDGVKEGKGISLQENLPHWSDFDEKRDRDRERERERERKLIETQSFDQTLEESLKEERAARAAICVELEKERNAAASAADEAMAMIHRLQDEKATVEMEARQFQRMVEEKATFDAEEMIILKDILLRREREKHFLEKEVEAYRDLLVETEDLESLSRNQNQESQENQDSQEKRAFIVQELDGTVTENAEKARDLYKSDSEVAYSRVRDVYMVKDETGKKSLGESYEQSSGKTEETLQGNGVVVSGIARKLPPLCRPRRKSLSSSGSRRKSMSAVDYEKLKIESEVELLRERLKTVQEEREQLTRRLSLPHLSSKVKEVFKLSSEKSLS